MSFPWTKPHCNYRDVTHFEEIYTKNEEEYVKVREKNRKVVIYQTEGNKRSLGNEELEKTIQLLTRRSQEQKEVCKELKSKEKAAMEKIDDCYQKVGILQFFGLIFQ